jgi:hypothetical protein
VVSWFSDLDSTRTTSAVGPEPLRYQEIEAYQRLTRQQIRGWELIALLEMDAAVLREWYKQSGVKTKKS